jgi:hypothetical protein
MKLSGSEAVRTQVAETVKFKRYCLEKRAANQQEHRKE